MADYIVLTRIQGLRPGQAVEPPEIIDLVPDAPVTLSLLAARAIILADDAVAKARDAPEPNAALGIDPANRDALVNAIAALGGVAVFPESEPSLLAIISDAGLADEVERRFVDGRLVSFALPGALDRLVESAVAQRVAQQTPGEDGASEKMEPSGQEGAGAGGAQAVVPAPPPAKAKPSPAKRAAKAK